MSTINGLPAHALLVHFIVVLAPLVAILAIVCAAWPTARRHLVWLELVLAAVILVLTPLTTDAGEWLEHNTDRSPLLQKHTELGDTMIYFAVALAVAAVALAVIHVLEKRGRAVGNMVAWTVAVAVVLVSVATVVQVYRIGESGASATWSEAVAASDAH